jgi:hypothetical protein
MFSDVSSIGELGSAIYSGGGMQMEGACVPWGIGRRFQVERWRAWMWSECIDVDRVP